MKIQIILRRDIQDLAQAHLFPPSPLGMPVIYYNPVIGSVFPQEFLTFAYFHEIAHHQLGHLVSAALGVKPYSRENEFEADWYAVIQLKLAGFSIEQFKMAFETMDLIPSVDNEHVAGWERTQYLKPIIYGSPTGTGLSCRVQLAGRI